MQAPTTPALDNNQETGRRRIYRPKERHQSIGEDVALQEIIAENQASLTDSPSPVWESAAYESEQKPDVIFLPPSGYCQPVSRSLPKKPSRVSSPQLFEETALIDGAGQNWQPKKKQAHRAAAVFVAAIIFLQRDRGQILFAEILP